MKKRISALLLSASLCVSMMGTAFAAGPKLELDNGKLSFTGDTSELTGFDKGTVFEKKEDGTYKEWGDAKVTVSADGSIDVDWNSVIQDAISDTSRYGISFDETHAYWSEKPSGGNDDDDNNNGGTTSGNKKPVIDDGKDDDDDSSSTVIKTSGSGGASGASSKYIKNEPRGNQTVTPVTTPSTEWTSETNIPQFTDVASTDWFYNAVQFVGQHGMMAGSNGRFSPYDKLTRGMMAQILYNMEGAPGGTAASFPDVSSSDWFANAASWAASCGYMSGYSNGYFGPLDPITREQLASILYRYASAKGYDVTASAELTFIDGATTSSWSVPAMKWAVGAGVLSGKTGVSGSRLDPLGNATRAEVAQILMNFSQKIAR